MATAPAPTYSINVKYGSKSYSLNVVGNVTIEYSIKKSAAALEIDVDVRPGLVLVHQGTRLPKESLVQDVLKDNSITCCFLQSSTTVLSSLNSSTLSDINNRDELGKYLGYCSSCSVIAKVRPIYSCSSCKTNAFMMDRTVNLFEEDHDLITGSCNTCNSRVKPNIKYECTLVNVDDSHSAIFLPHLRENVYLLPCMKCEEKDPQVIKFACNHTMCLDCFSHMCKMQLGVNGFKNYEGLGYSISCPAKGDECSDSPIADPHHFYLVSAKKEFYNQFQENSLRVFQEEEEKERRGTQCQKCLCNLDMSQVQQAEVELPVGATPITAPQQTTTQAGTGWTSFLRVFRRTRTQPVPREMRQQVKCTSCQTAHCGECKMRWHEGKCIRMSTDQEAAANQFMIEPKKAAASEWK